MAEYTEYVVRDLTDEQRARFTQEAIRICMITTSSGEERGLEASWLPGKFQDQDEHTRLGVLEDETTLYGMILYRYNVQDQVDQWHPDLVRTVVDREFICGKGYGKFLNIGFEASVIKQTQDAQQSGAISRDIRNVLVLLESLVATVPAHQKFGYTQHGTRDKLILMFKNLPVPPVSGGRRARRRTARASSRTRSRSRGRKHKSSYTVSNIRSRRISVTS